MKLETDLLQRVQNDYVSYRYKEGMFVFPSLDETTIALVIDSFISWAETKGFLTDGKLDVDAMSER